MVVGDGLCSVTTLLDLVGIEVQDITFFALMRRTNGIHFPLIHIVTDLLTNSFALSYLTHLQKEHARMGHNFYIVYTHIILIMHKL